MNVAVALTASRLVLAPIFFILFQLPGWTGRMTLPIIVALWVVFLMIELSDILDGAVARRFNQVSDLGKLLDPFADVISRMTYFITFAAVGIMPGWIVLLLLYREYSIIFIRMMMYRTGTALAARKGGKLKAVFYAIAGGTGILVAMSRSLEAFSPYASIIEAAALAVFLISLVLAYLSLSDYLLVFFRHMREKGGNSSD
ncbi:MAG: CDP-alcohol phosphatidyltransferase family protein [Alkalispirochaetaceae bacterium]